MKKAFIKRNIWCGETRIFRHAVDAVDDEVPFTFTPLGPGGSLDGTVWAGTIQVSHSFDCTSFPRFYSNYAYNTQPTLGYIGHFTINGDNFTFSNFYGHGGRITLKRMR